MVGLGAIAAGLGGLFLGRKKENVPTTKQIVSEEPEIKIDVSIPYNAAALMAYEKVIGEYDAATYAKFEELYKEKAVAEVTLKKITRELQEKIDQTEAAIAKLTQQIWCGKVIECKVLVYETAKQVNQKFLENCQESIEMRKCGEMTPL